MENLTLEAAIGAAKLFVSVYGLIFESIANCMVK